MNETVAPRLRGLLRAASKAARSRAAVSVAVSAVIISASILTITVIAAYVSRNILEMQMETTEFEQAKMNMLLVNELVAEVGLKHGSGGSVRFNARAGGIGFVKNETAFSVEISAKGTGATPINLNSTYFLAYRGGSLTGTYDHILVGIPNPNSSRHELIPPGLILNRTSDPLGYLWVEQKGGPWIKADYTRIKVISAGNVTVGTSLYQFVDLTFVKLVPGTFGGSGTQTVKVQNLGVTVNSYSYDSTVTITVEGAPPLTIAKGTSAGIVVMVTVAEVMISIT